MIELGAAISDGTKLLLRYQLDTFGRPLIKMLLTGYAFYMCTMSVQIDSVDYKQFNAANIDFINVFAGKVLWCMPTYKEKI